MIRHNRMIYKRIMMALLAAGLVLAALSPCTAGTESATDQLKASIDQILDVLRDQALKAQEQKEIRRAKLRRIAGERFDYRRMSQLSLARHWRGRSDEEKDEFTRLFSTLLEDSYMSKIESYTDEKVVYLTERIKKKKSKEYAKINTKIITQTAEIPINYMMYRAGAGPWRVYDMVIEGVSMVNNYRSQFGQILEKKSFGELIEQLKEKKE
ncbi:MAG: ABC transporter substrate-binding protein [Desulfobacter sp.]|nr:MAG: ABC transporter substrate-binding protein [Desulfobacter sp.]